LNVIKTIKYYIYQIFIAEMKKIIIIVLFFGGFLSLNAQYTEIINSKRPGFSESPYGVGTNVFQVEAGTFFKKSDLKSTFYTDNAFGGNLFLRYGKFLEKLEINLDFAYQRDKRIFHNVFDSNTYSVNGISKLTLGAKYLIYNQKYADRSKEIRSWKKRHAFDFKRLIPSVGAYIGWNSNFLGKGFKANGMSFKGAVLLQNDISSRFVILTNLVVDNILQKDLEYGYILTATYALNEKWSIFGEHQGVFKKLASNEFQYGLGAAYLVNNNLQVDISGRTSLIGGGYTNYISLGGSWRLDKHGKKKKSTALKGTKEPFFKRIFKKKKRKPKVRKVKTKKRRKSRRAKRGTPSFHKKKKKKRRKKRRRSKRRKNKDKD